MQAHAAPVRARGTRSLYVDLHVTDGAKFEHDVAVMVAPRRAAAATRSPSRAPRCRDGAASAGLPRAATCRCRSIRRSCADDDPASGFAVGERAAALLARLLGGAQPPRHPGRDPQLAHLPASGCASPATCSWRCSSARRRRRAAGARPPPTPPTRARAALAGTRGGARATRPTDAVAHHRLPRLRLRARAVGRLGRRLDALRRDASPQIWRVPLRDELVPELTVARAARPATSSPAGYAAAVARAASTRTASRYRALDARAAARRRRGRSAPTRSTFGAKPFEGRTPRHGSTGAWAPERRDVAAPAALFVPIAQPRARLVAAPARAAGARLAGRVGLLQRRLRAQGVHGGLRRRGGRARDAGARPGGARRVRAARSRDPAFAAEPAARLDFFYRRHPAWDERRDLLPVFRPDAIMR